jgi:hypothetical protein
VLERLGTAWLKLVSRQHAEMFEGTGFADVYNYRFERTSSSEPWRAVIRKSSAISFHKDAAT